MHILLAIPFVFSPNSSELLMRLCRRWNLWSSQHSTIPDLDSSLAHGHGGVKDKEVKNRGMLSFSCSRALHGRSGLFLCGFHLCSFCKPPPGLCTGTVCFSLPAFFHSLSIPALPKSEFPNWNFAATFLWNRLFDFRWENRINMPLQSPLCFFFFPPI